LLVRYLPTVERQFLSRGRSATSALVSGHSHSHEPTSFGRAFAIGIALNIAFVIIEAVYGFYANSMALLSDAGHNFADALALVFSWYGIWIARKPSTQTRTPIWSRNRLTINLWLSLNSPNPQPANASSAERPAR